MLCFVVSTVIGFVLFTCAAFFFSVNLLIVCTVNVLHACFFFFHFLQRRGFLILQCSNAVGGPSVIFSCFFYFFGFLHKCYCCVGRRELLLGWLFGCCVTLLNQVLLLHLL